ncbi:SIR2 family protein [Salinicola sp. V024]|uniref:SIR2 family protein n=1 Tax=Salinicola sp. V024 TaxID=3459609 RepID=UPI004044A014
MSEHGKKIEKATEDIDYFSRNNHLHEEIDNDENISIIIKKGDEEYELKEKSKALFYGAPVEYELQISAMKNTYRQKILRSDEYEDNEQNYGKLITRIRNKSTIIPFIGAGFSVSAGCPSWSDYIESQAKKARLPAQSIKERVKSGCHEEVMSEVIEALTMDRFKRDFELSFNNNNISPELSPCRALGNLFGKCIVTTNFDRVIEESIYPPFIEKAVGREDSGRFIKAMFSGERYLLKLHGNIDEEKDRVLTQEEYNSAYGADGINWSHPIPWKLKKIFECFSVIFLGCSLINDRYLKVLAELQKEQKEFMPDHFSILTAPDDDDERIKQDGFLASLGITPIWFTAGDWEARRSQ